MDRPAGGPGRVPGRPWLVLLVAGFLLVTLVRLVSSEMFLDGVTYAAIARNMAEGRGSFWTPFYSGDFSNFRSHPPFAFWMESWAFRFLGDSPGVEIAWGLLLGAMALALMTGLAREARAACPEPDRFPDGFAGLLVLFAPIVPWSMTNNMIENTLLVLVLAASWAGVNASRAPRLFPPVPLVLASLFTGIAVLTKGPPALFVLSVPLWAAIFLRTGSPGRAFVHVAAMGVGALGLVAAVTLVGGQDGWAFWADYIPGQVFGSLGGQREVATQPLFLTGELLLNLAWPMAACFVVVAFFSASTGRPAASWKFHLATALSATLPFLVLRKQMSWYLVPGLAFFALSLGDRYEAAARGAEAWMTANRTRWTAVRVLAAFLVAMSLIVGVGLRGTLNTTLEVAIRDEWRGLQGERTDNDRFSEYCWRNFVRDVMSEQELSLHPGDRVTDLTQGCRWRVLAYLQRHFQVDLTQDNLSLALAERYPEQKGQDPENCKIAAGWRGERLVMYRCDKTMDSQVLAPGR